MFGVRPRNCVIYYCRLVELVAAGKRKESANARTTTSVVNWQGRVIDVLGDQLYVQLFSWIFGEDSDQFIIPFKQTIWKETTKTGWSFYNSSKELKYRYDRYDEQRKMARGIAESEKPKALHNGQNNEH